MTLTDRPVVNTRTRKEMETHRAGILERGSRRMLVDS